VALTWDISECPDWINTKDERGVTDALIWYSVPLGYGQGTWTPLLGEVDPR